MVQADVREYSRESQDRVREEFTEQGCLPIEGEPFDFKNCTIPEIFSYMIDYYKSREQTRVAKAAQ